MGGVSNYYPDFGFDLLLKVTEVKILKKLRSWRILLLFDLECSNLVWICIRALSTSTPHFGPIGFQIWPGRLEAILENRRAMSLVVIICFRSHFVTISGIDLKLCTCVPLGHGTYHTEIWSAQIPGNQNWKYKSAVTPELMAGWSLYYYHSYI
jgi:hypothetical protein